MLDAIDEGRQRGGHTEPVDPLSQNLLVRAALEARLARSASRLDAGARNDRVKAATLFECAEKGYSNLTIADIAQRAKVSTATIYADYKDRDALLVAAIELLFEIVSGDVIELPQSDDPVEQVELLLRAHGYVYAEPLITWFFRLHVHLAWSGHEHLHASGQRTFEGIDAFWGGYLGSLVDSGWLEPLDLPVVIPLLLGPIERCTIISRLGCGDDETNRPRLVDVARHAAKVLFAVWGGPAWRAANGSRSGRVPRDLADIAPGLPALQPLPRPVSASVLLDEALATATDAQMPDQRKHRILLAAAVECQERGYGAASMNEVAARSKCSLATLYKHFDDKASLFASALVDGLQRLGGYEAFDGSCLPAHQRVAAAVFAVAARSSDPDSVWMHTLAMASEVSGTDRVVAIARGNRDLAEAFLGRELAQVTGQAGQSPEELALTINFLLGGIERAGLLTLILFGKSACDRDKLAVLAAAAAGCLVRIGALPDPDA